MSERIPTADDIRQALRFDGWTHDEANEGIDRIKRRGIGIGHEMARETMQASIGGAFRKAQAIAWDEGHHAGRNGHGRFVNPYREGGNDE